MKLLKSRAIDRPCLHLSNSIAYVEPLQVCAAIKHVTVYFLQFLWQTDFLKRRATAEHIPSIIEVFNVVVKNKRREFWTVGKCKVSIDGHFMGNRYRLQAMAMSERLDHKLQRRRRCKRLYATIRKRPIQNCFHLRHVGIILQFLATVERILADFSDRGIPHHLFKILAPEERAGWDFQICSRHRHAVAAFPHNDSPQRCASYEHSGAESGQRLWQSHLCQRRTVGKTSLKIGDGLWKHDALQSFTRLKRTRSDACQCCGQFYVFQCDTPPKCLRENLCQSSAGNLDIGQIGVAIEATPAYCPHR